MIDKRPEPTINNARFGEVRADELRLHDIIEVFLPLTDITVPAVVRALRIEGDDVIVTARKVLNWARVEFTTSIGNGITVTGRYEDD